MRAIRIHQTGGPEVLKLEEVELPKPGKGEVRLRQHAVGVNFIDVYHRNGFYPMALPFTPGTEGAGEVTEVAGRGSRTSRRATASPMQGQPAPTRRNATSRRASLSSCRARSPTKPAPR